MRCDYYETGRCRSCTWLPRPFADQVQAKQERAQALLSQVATWLPAVVGPESGFRNKAKMVVAGTVEQPTLGILDPHGEGVDLRACGLHEAGLADALPVLAAFVTRAGLTPYDVATRRGELKHLLVTISPDGELMVRFVVRSQEPLARVRKHLPWLLERVPVRVASLNLQPEHKAVLEGEREIVLTEDADLAMRLGAVTLHVRPQSFFQTNTAIARALYDTARDWADELHPTSVWDLYCGVGGFALHLARPGRRVRGIEVSVEAIASARRSAAEMGVEVDFVDGDATAVVGTAPDLVVVNPPRRGLGSALTTWLEASAPRHVLYSSCNPESLARDLSELVGYDAVRAQVFDMFPQTAHAEVLTLLRRRSE